MAVPSGTPKPPTGPPAGSSPTGTGTSGAWGGGGAIQLGHPIPGPTPAPKPPVVGPGGVAGGHPPVGGSGGGTPDPLSQLTGDQRNAYSALVTIFNSYNLGSLAPDILKYVQNGFNADTITLLLQDTPAYKQRFAGNQIRLNNGYAVLSPADYIATENAYRQTMRAAGLPSGFYDSPSDFSNFIGSDVSASEMNSRVQLASQATLTASPQYTEALKQMGLSHGDLTAYFLDPTKALPILQQQATTAAIGSEALVRGLSFDQGYAKQLAQAGFSQSQAAQGYSQIAGEFSTLQKAAGAFGQNYGFGQEERAVFQPGAGQDEILRQRLESYNRAQQSGFVGGAQQGLARHGGGQLS
jgi:hypothetical protein